MKKIYGTPELEIVKLIAQDICNTSWLTAIASWDGDIGAFDELFPEI